MSSVAYSCFQKSMPGTSLALVAGRGLLELPLWHSAIFSRQIPSMVREMREHSYCCPRLVNRGLRVPGDCLTATGQVNTEIIPKIPSSYRAVYQTIVDLADWAAASQGDGAALSPPPPVDAWSFANLRRARARTVRIEERQDSEVWEHLREFNVPPRLYHFVLRALWRKVPVAARMFAFGLVSTPDCTLCSQQEDHTHMLKQCPYLSIPF